MAERIVRIDYNANKGIDQTKDPIRVFASVPANNVVIHGLLEGENIDIDSTGRPGRRRGFEEVIAAPNSHSLKGWTDMALIVTANTLKRINLTSPTTLTSLKTGIYGERVSYTRWLDDIYFSDGLIIGKISSGVYSDLPSVASGLTRSVAITHVSTTRKLMPPGQILDFYQNRLLVASGSFIRMSDPLAFHRTHKKNGLFHTAEGYITLMKPVNGGVFVSDNKSIYFLKTEGGVFNKAKTDIADYPAVIHAVSDIKPEDTAFTGDLPSGKYFKFLTTRGICIAGDNGFFKNLTDEKYPELTAVRGSALYRKLAKTIFGQTRTIKQVVFTYEN